jgi:hypothetical protein
MKAALVNLHRKLLPEEAELGVMPYIWLCYLGMYFVGFLFTGMSCFHLLTFLCVYVMFL